MRMALYFVPSVSMADRQQEGSQCADDQDGQVAVPQPGEALRLRHLRLQVAVRVPGVAVLCGGQLGQHVHRRHVQERARREQHRDSGRVERVERLLLLLPDAEVSEDREQRR